MNQLENALTIARKHGWSSQLPGPVRDELLAASRLRVLPARGNLFKIGDPPGGLFALVVGCLAGEAALSGSPPQKGILLHPVTWFGEGPLSGTDSRMVGIWATRESCVLAIELADFRRVATRHPEVWRHLARLAVENQAKTMGLAHDLMVRGGRQRLAAILARLAGLREPLVPSHPVVDATHAEIADIANLSRSVVSRFLQDMESAGILRLGWANVEVIAPERLLRLAEALSD